MFVTHAKNKKLDRVLNMNDRQRRMYDFLNSQHIGVLSTVTPDLNPHGSVVYYAVDKDFCIHILTKVETRKYDNLKHNDHCMLSVYSPITQATAQITAIAQEQPDDAHVQHAINVIFERVRHTEHNIPPIMKLMAGKFTSFRLAPVQIRMAIYSRPDSGEYDEMFESIESFELDCD